MADNEEKNLTEKPEDALYSTRPERFSVLKDANKKIGALRKSVKNKNFRSGNKRLVVLIVILCFIAGIAGGFLGARVFQASPTASTAVQKQYISDESSLISSIAKEVGPSVVSINVQSQTTQPDFFGYSQQVSQASAGTGFIISPTGIIVTNRHVVPAGTTSVSVTLADGTTYNNVQVIGRTASSSSQDIAFLKIPNLKGETLTPVTLGDSSQMQVGDKVIAIGNALGQFQNTVTSGIISGYGREVVASDQSGTSQENLTDLFQTDAAINEGNSGGPLVNMNGEVIGINTAVASSAQNIGFAQPINDLKGPIDSILASGKLQIPYLGVRYVSLTNDLAYQYNLPVTRGAYVTSSTGESAVISGGPADKAGVKRGDVITKVNNITINQNTSLTGAISRFKVGDKVALTIVRGGKTLTLHASLGAAPTG